MRSKPSMRRNYLINKKFQLDFAVRFLVLIVLAAAAALVLFLSASKGTLTTSYGSSGIKILRTSDFFFPMLLMSGIGVILVTGVIGIIVLVYLSHRIAGPIYRFHQAMNEFNEGDMTHRFKLREADQFMDLADRMNLVAQTMDDKIGAIKTQVSELSGLIQDLQKISASHPSPEKELAQSLHTISSKLTGLQDAANHFKTTRDT